MPKRKSDDNIDFTHNKRLCVKNKTTNELKEKMVHNNSLIDKSKDSIDFFYISYIIQLISEFRNGDTIFNLKWFSFLEFLALYLARFSRNLIYGGLESLFRTRKGQ
jgi:hypothetical protein